MPQPISHSESQNRLRPRQGALTGILGGLTIEPPVIPPVAAVSIRPEFIRLPKSGTMCPYSGLSRSTLNSLILGCAANGYKPSVRSHVLRQHGRLKGVRLIDFESLCSYIRGQTDTIKDSQKVKNVVSFKRAA